MKYEGLPTLDREQALRGLESKDLEELRTIVAALKWMDDEDDDWIRAKLESFLDHEDRWVCGNAIIGLSELARTGRLADAEHVEGLVSRFREIEKHRPELAGPVQDALGDMLD